MNIEKNYQSIYIKFNISYFRYTANWFQESMLRIKVEPS